MNHKNLRMLLLTALFAALTAVGAFLRIPAGPISFTLQLFFTCMAGILLGPWWGAVSQLVYLLLGLAGVPIFTEGGGLMYFAKPTFGFLLGLPLTALVVGLLGRRAAGFWRLLAAGAVGTAVLYAVGLPYLYFTLGGAWSVGKTLVSGCLIFLPFDAMKIIVSALLGVRLVPLLCRRN